MPQQKIRPWLPPAGLSTDSRNSSPGEQSPVASSGGTPSRRESLDEGQLQLQVLDVTSTAVALSVFTPSPLATNASSSDAVQSTSHDGHGESSSQPVKPPTISIQLNRRPWPHVAHAGSSSAESSSPERGSAARGSETTVIIYGLDPGRDYEISLEVVGPDETAETEHPRATIEIATGAETISEDAVEPNAVAASEPEFSQPTPQASSSSAHDGPPPPYSATVPPSPPTESQLRALLKKIRASSKRTESVLNASISSLRKSVEKGLKEDQRARTRIVGLEEAIRKAGEGEREMRTSEMEACEERLRELEELEAEVKEELELRKEGKTSAATPQVPPPVPAVPVQESDVANAAEEGNEEEEPHEGIAELSRELDHLNKLIDEAEKETRRTARDTIKALEHELNQIDAEISQLDREEAHRFGLANLSSDSLDRVDPSRAPPPLPIPPAPSTSSSGFNIRWRKNAPASPGSAAPAQQDPRSFGRFFRRGASNANADVLPSRSASSSNASLVPAQVAQQQYAQAHQSLWAPPNSAPPDVTSSPTPSTAAVPRSAGSAGLRQRSGSLTLLPYGSAATSNDESVSPRVASMPIVIPRPSEKTKDKSKEKERDKDSSSASSGGTIASSWSRIGTWSQVVTRGPKSTSNDKT